jgi:hypothetical protein
VKIRKFLKARGVPKRDRDRIERAVKAALGEMGFPVVKSQSADAALKAARRQMRAEVAAVHAQLAVAQAEAGRIGEKIRQLGGTTRQPPDFTGASVADGAEAYLRAWAVTSNG